MKVHGREVVFKALSGSVNRNLNDNKSDRDIKLFVLPTFDDLYNGVIYKNFTTSDAEDIEIHDVRKLEKLLFNSNLTFLELLFSVEIDTYDYKEINQIIGMRDDLARINLRNLYNSCYGMYHGQMKDLLKPNSDKQQEIIDKFGYNTKKAMMSLHFLKFISKFYSTDFNDFSSSIVYQGEEREFMLNVKHGGLAYNQFIDLTKDVEAETKLIEDAYMSQKVNQETNNKLQRLLRSLIKNNIDLV
ncbi:nucleotidyltransferase domain-containing protein [Paenibacillus filicis]|uniref:Nucleotidyltransferase domain-containing protein n=1 Tax=Paenibacillus filicis TaxID=669464 RepID=A0ABU9DVN0_9BACL